MEGISKKIANYFKKNYNCHIAFRVNSLGNLIKNNNYISQNEYKFAVFKLTCGDCPMVYTG